MDYLEKNKKLIYIIYIISYLSLLIGFFYGEDSAGGAKKDYILTQTMIIGEGFKLGIYNFLFEVFPIQKLQHSPFFYVLTYISQKFLGINFTRLLILHLFLLIPYFFYKSLKTKYETKNYILIIIPLIFFLSPNFRSIAIWSGRECISLIFLNISLFYYFKFIRKKYHNYIFYSFLYLALGSYVAPEIGIISLIYLYQYINLYGYKRIYTLIGFNILLSVPFFYYFLEYFNYENFSHPIYYNLYKNFPFFFSSLFVYTVPFIISKNLNEYFQYLKRYILILIIILVSHFLLFNLENNNIGGGIINLISNKINLSELVLIFSSIGIMNFFFIFRKYFLLNIFILIVLFIQTSLNFHFFQKYLELTWILYFLLLFKDEKIYNFFLNRKFLIILFSFYLIYFLASLLLR